MALYTIGKFSFFTRIFHFFRCYTVGGDSMLNVVQFMSSGPGRKSLEMKSKNEINRTSIANNRTLLKLIVNRILLLFY